MNEQILKQEIKNLEDEKKQKLDNLNRLIVDSRLKNDSNVSYKLMQLEQAYNSRDIDKFKTVFDSLNKYVNYHTSEVDYEVVDALNEMYNDSKFTGLRLPGRLKSDCYMSKGLITLIGGGTGAGKTRFMNNLILDYGMFDEKKIAVFSLELPPGTLYNLILIMWLAEKNRNNPNYKDMTLMEMRRIIVNIMKDKTTPAAKEIISYIEKMKKSIHVFKLKKYSPQNIYSSIKFAEIEKGVKYDLALIDYFQLLKPSQDVKGSIVESYKYIADELKDMNLEANIPLVLLAQLSQDENRKINSEQTSDSNGFKYCGDISNHSENIFKLVRNKNGDGSYESRFELRQVKNRFGYLKTVELNQDMESGVIR